MRSLHARNGKVAGAVLAGAVVALAVPGSVAVAVLSSPDVWQVSVGPTATLQAKGAAVSVPIQVTCPAGSSTSLDVSLTQRAGKSVVSGGRSMAVTCTGAEQTVVVNVVAQTGSRVFKTGPAFVQADLFGCTYACGTFATDGRTVDVVRR